MRTRVPHDISLGSLGGFSLGEKLNGCGKIMNHMSGLPPPSRRQMLIDSVRDLDEALPEDAKLA
jgi:hypothetical protein